MKPTRTFTPVLTGLAVAACVVAINPWETEDPRKQTTETAGQQLAGSFIVQAPSVELAEAAVREVGGDVTRRLGVINAVAAVLTADQQQRLPGIADDILVHADARLTVSGKKKKNADEVQTADSGTSEPTASSDSVSVDSESGSTKKLCSNDQKQVGDIKEADETMADGHTGDVAADGDESDAVAVHSADGLESHYPRMIGADQLHAAGIDGRGVGIAVIDTGLWENAIEAFVTDSRMDVRRKVIAVDVINGTERMLFDGTCYEKVDFDLHGHGTHVSSIAASSARSANGTLQGVAPAADLISIRAFDENGGGNYTDVIAAIQWAIDHRREHNIRVLNLSFSGTPQSWYWEDPLNQAVMKAWGEGIVVVAAAGNTGPDPMTIGVPGNVPYVITVGALSNNYTPYDPSDDFLAYFSSTGPTYEGHVKPDLVAPGAHMLGIVPGESSLYTLYGEDNALSYGDNHKLGENFFVMSGTSQATAAVAGAAALLIQKDSKIVPDNVKCALMSTARSAMAPSGEPMYSVFQQGAGLINVNEALHNGDRACANRGMDILADLSGDKHYQGPAAQEDDGTFVVRDVDKKGEYDANKDGAGYLWDSGYTWDIARGWSVGYTWDISRTWSVGYTWDVARTWSVGYTWDVNVVGYTWDRRSKAMGISGWIDHEPRRE